MYIYIYVAFRALSRNSFIEAGTILLDTAEVIVKSDSYGDELLTLFNRLIYIYTKYYICYIEQDLCTEIVTNKVCEWITRVGQILYGSTNKKQIIISRIAKAIMAWYINKSSMS